MREFGSSASRAASLTLPAKILYSVFAALVLVGCYSSIALYDGMVHFEARATPADLYHRLVEHYRTLDRAKLLETSHAHLFTMPILMLVAGHLFLLSSASARLKLAAVILACVLTSLHLLAPWLIVWSDGAAAATLVFPITGGFLLLTMALLLVVPIWQMWRS